MESSIAEFLKRELACELLPTTMLGGGSVVICVVGGAVLCAALGSQQMEVWWRVRCRTIHGSMTHQSKLSKWNEHVS